jgi:hypothetical protein
MEAGSNFEISKSNGNKNLNCGLLGYHVILL